MFYVKHLTPGQQEGVFKGHIIELFAGAANSTNQDLP